MFLLLYFQKLLVPTPVAVKNAGIPAPPALILSANVPCGLNSNSISPDKYCFSNNLFSPTYEDIAFLFVLFQEAYPKPCPSVPALLDITFKLELHFF